MPAAPLPRPPALDQARQLLRVLAPDWDASSGTLQRLVRATSGSSWQAEGAPLPVSLGRHGLAWGLGLHTAPPSPQKQEGDGRSPAGLFAIPQLFGQAQALAALGQPARLPCLPCHLNLFAVDDPASRHYNRIVDGRQVPRDWQSAEAMERDDERYAIGAVIAHNPAGIPGAGSCIFLHVHGGPGQPTAGCTAAAREQVQALCAWLDDAANPLLLQLPAGIYAQLAPAWGLPPAQTP